MKNDKAPTIFSPRGTEIIRMPHELWSAVETCDPMLRGNGMQMQIVCQTCLEHGQPNPYVEGDNQRNGATFTMTCAHAERRLDLASTH